MSSGENVTFASEHSTAQRLRGREGATLGKRSKSFFGGRRGGRVFCLSSRTPHFYHDILKIFPKPIRRLATRCHWYPSRCIPLPIFHEIFY
jgi:hypothetical protein